MQPRKTHDRTQVNGLKTLYHTLLYIDHTNLMPAEWAQRIKSTFRRYTFKGHSRENLYQDGWALFQLAQTLGIHTCELYQAFISFAKNYRKLNDILLIYHAAVAHDQTSSELLSMVITEIAHTHSVSTEKKSALIHEILQYAKKKNQFDKRLCYDLLKVANITQDIDLGLYTYEEIKNFPRSTSSLDYLVLNQCIRFLDQSNDYKAIHDVKREMVELGLDNPQMYATLINIARKHGDFEQVKELYKESKHYQSPILTHYFMTAAAKCGHTEEALQAYRDAYQEGIQDHSLDRLEQAIRHDSERLPWYHIPGTDKSLRYVQPTFLDKRKTSQVFLASKATDNTTRSTPLTPVDYHFFKTSSHASPRPATLSSAWADDAVKLMTKEEFEELFVDIDLHVEHTPSF